MLYFMSGRIGMVLKGAKHDPAPIREEGAVGQSKTEYTDISGVTTE
jgi:hypothetical protein